MATRRQQRVSELLHHEIGKMLQIEIQDPRIGFSTITEVTISPDLREATIYISLLSGEAKDLIDGLTSATPFIKRELGKRLQLRCVPNLNFKVDTSTAYGAKIEGLLSEIEIPPETDEDVPSDS